MQMGRRAAIAVHPLNSMGGGGKAHDDGRGLRWMGMGV
jgi:hypothetical protein